MSEKKTKLNSTSPALDIPTPNLDELERGPWPSYVSGLKRLAASDAAQAKMMRGVLGTLEHSFVNRRGYWKGGTVGGHRRRGRVWWWCDPPFFRVEK